MSRRGREIEMILLAMFAAVPLYMTNVIGAAPLLLFHLVMAGMAIRLATGRGPDLLPPVLMRTLAVAYIGFYIIDAAMISRSAIAASTHLVLFIAAYQPIESLQRNNLAQRLLTAALIFIASLATSTHIAILPFVALFGFVMFRQMIYVSHMETVRAIGQPYTMAPASKAALFYICGTIIIGAALFPLLPRLRNPVVPGFIGALQSATTGLSDSIDFNEDRTSSADPTVVARVWMGPQAMPFFTPLRLRGAVYDSYSDNQWLQTARELESVPQRRGVFRIAQPVGFARAARVQQLMRRSDGRLYLPVGTYAVSGLTQMYHGKTRESFYTSPRAEMVTYQASMARNVESFRAEPVRIPAYPATPETSALARQIVGAATGAEESARLIERYLLDNFQYVQRAQEIGRSAMTVDDFLLRVRKGHCEYFAAGMVALLSTLDVPSRIVGGFYGGRMNPLTGYLIVRHEDAHAWVEVWNGSHWVTFDPTPPSLRPGNTESNFLRSWLSAVAESATYLWDRYVLTFGLADQVALAVEMITRTRQAFGNAKGWLAQAAQLVRSPAAIFGYAVALGLLLLIWLIPFRRRPAFELLAHHLRGHGIEVGDAMTIEEALDELREENPDAAAQLAPLVALYEEERFSARHDRTRSRLLRKRLAELRV